MKAPADRRWAVALRRELAEADPSELVALTAARIGEEIGGDAPRLLADATCGGGIADDARDRFAAACSAVGHPPGGWRNPWLVGLVHEQAASAAERKARGAWYTPRRVVDGLVHAALDQWTAAELPDLVVDPTCGGGAFLLAALDHLVARGLAPEHALSRVRGVDLDPLAVAATRWSLVLWAAVHNCGREHGFDVRCGDALVELASMVASGVESSGGSRLPRVLVVGNPPFASPLKSGAIPEVAAEARQADVELLGPYADLGAVHLVNALRAAGEVGSVVALVLPQSILAGRDTEGLRRWCSQRSPLVGLWAAREALFDAGVRPCAPILRRADEQPPIEEQPQVEGQPYPVALFGGPDVAPRGSGTGRWGSLAADALGAPPLPTMAGPTLGSLVSATAGFRDEHYALVEACREWDGPGSFPAAPDGLRRVITVGSVDPLCTDWGRRSCRFGGETRLRPVVATAELPDKVRRWCERLDQPKVLLATQTKLLEPVVDRAGTAVPATPLVAVLAAPEVLDRVAAVLLAPPVVLWAWRRWFGTALSSDAVKLAARDVGSLPLPRDLDAWDRAAALVADADALDPAAAWDVADTVAEVMNGAYGAEAAVLDWWRSRRKQRPSPGEESSDAPPADGAGPNSLNS